MPDIAYINDKKIILRAEADECTGYVTLYAIDQQANKVYSSDERIWDYHRFHIERATAIPEDLLKKADVDLTLNPYSVNFGEIDTSDSQLIQLGIFI
jgi:hypothetical protein